MNTTRSLTLNGIATRIILNFTAITFLCSSIVAGQNNTLYFDGQDDYVLISNYTNMSPVNAVTMEAWIKGPPATFQQFIYDRIEQNDGYGLTVDPSGAARVTINGGSAICVSTTIVLDGTWHHIAGTYDVATGKIIVYVDGIPEDSTGYSQNITYSPEPRNGIGGPGASATGHFNGQIDELRIWSYARSASQIQNNMCTDISPLNNPDLLAYWKFNEGSGTVLTDISLYSNDGSLINGPIWVTDSICLPTSVYDYDLSTTIDIFPNPATDHFMIQVAEGPDEQLSFKIFDPIGRLLKRSSLLRPGTNHIRNEFGSSDLIYVLIFDATNEIKVVHPVMIR